MPGRVSGLETVSEGFSDRDAYFIAPRVSRPTPDRIAAATKRAGTDRPPIFARASQTDRRVLFSAHTAPTKIIAQQFLRTGGVFGALHLLPHLGPHRTHRLREPILHLIDLGAAWSVGEDSAHVALTRVPKTEGFLCRRLLGVATDRRPLPTPGPNAL
jgi:hypothetical protein